MNDKTAKKELQRQYKERTVIGGVFAIKNTTNNKLLLDATTDLQGSKNRFSFAQMTGSCVSPKLQVEWDSQSGQSFAFEVLEELKKEATQTDAEFAADIKVLKELWIEKLDPKTLY